MGEYLRNLTQSLIGELRITERDLVGELDRGAHILYKRRGEEIVASLKKMRPETLGRIVFYGRGNGDKQHKTSLSEACGGSIFNIINDYTDGRSLLIRMACAAVVAEATDILGCQLDAETKAMLG